MQAVVLHPPMQVCPRCVLRVIGHSAYDDYCLPVCSKHELLSFLSQQLAAPGAQWGHTGLCRGVCLGPAVANLCKAAASCPRPPYTPHAPQHLTSNPTPLSTCKQDAAHSNPTHAASPICPAAPLPCASTLSTPSAHTPAGLNLAHMHHPGRSCTPPPVPAPPAAAAPAHPGAPGSWPPHMPPPCMIPQAQALQAGPGVPPPAPPSCPPPGTVAPPRPPPGSPPHPATTPATATATPAPTPAPAAGVCLTADGSGPAEGAGASTTSTADGTANTSVCSKRPAEASADADADAPPAKRVATDPAPAPADATLTPSAPSASAPGAGDSTAPPPSTLAPTQPQPPAVPPPIPTDHADAVCCMCLGILQLLDGSACAGSSSVSTAGPGRPCTPGAAPAEQAAASAAPAAPGPADAGPATKPFAPQPLQQARWVVGWRCAVGPVSTRRATDGGVARWVECTATLLSR